MSKIWMITSLVILTVLSIITKSNILQIIAVICGVIYVFNTVFENKYGQIFGAINSLLYGIIMFSNGIYGTAIYDIFYCIPMQIYTFFTWGKDKNGKNKINISRCTTLQRIYITIATTLVITLYSVLANKLNVQFAIVDGISIILGLVGLYMTSKKKIEQWYTFIISNIAMLALWTIKSIENVSNIPMLVMWVIYLVNNCYGLYSWNRKLKNNQNENNKQKATV